MKKWIVGSVIGLAVIVGAASYAYYQVKQEIGKQVVSILSDPATQTEINKITASLPQTVNSSTVNAAVNSVGGTNPSEGNSHNVGSSSSSQASTSASSPTKSTGGSSTSASSVPQFTSRQQVVNYAESHFTQTEIAHYTKLYIDRSKLTSAQKAQIKQEILSHFTPAEIQAMAAAVKKYQ